MGNIIYKKCCNDNKDVETKTEEDVMKTKPVFYNDNEIIYKTLTPYEMQYFLCSFYDCKSNSLR